MTSYQKLKLKCEKLEGQIRLFKNALTIVEVNPETVIGDDANVSIIMRMAIERNKIRDERIRHELQCWVAENLDRDTIMYLLDLKEKLNNDK